jgi:hypothetical protein
MSIDGINGHIYIYLFKERNRLSLYLRLWPFECNLWKYNEVVCGTVFIPKLLQYFHQEVLMRLDKEPEIITVKFSHYIFNRIFSSVVNSLLVSVVRII